MSSSHHRDFSTERGVWIKKKKKKKNIKWKGEQIENGNVSNEQ